MELEDIVKMGAAAALTAADMEGAGPGAAATRGLLGDYSSAMPTPTPHRTERTPMARDVVMEEARNMIALTESQTPLKVGSEWVLNGSWLMACTAAAPAPAAAPAAAPAGGMGLEWVVAHGLHRRPRHRPRRRPRRRNGS